MNGLSASNVSKDRGAASVPTNFDKLVPWPYTHSNSITLHVELATSQSTIVIIHWQRVSGVPPNRELCRGTLASGNSHLHGDDTAASGLCWQTRKQH